MGRMNLSDCRVRWQDISEQLTRSAELLSEVELQAMQGFMEAGPTERLAIVILVAAIRDASVELNGVPYMTRPQNEWVGGEKWVTRAPNLVTGPQITSKDLTVFGIIVDNPTIGSYLECNVPSGYLVHFTDAPPEHLDWLDWRLTSTVGVRVERLIRSTRWYLDQLPDMDNRDSHWLSVSRQCRVFAYG